MREEERRHSRLFEQVILKSWWVIATIFLLYFAFDEGMRRKKREERRLQDKLTAIEVQKKEALSAQAALILELASKDDPASLELILMKRLGLVPEGSTKIIFK